MSRIILLDSGPLSLASHPKSTDLSTACNRWLQSRLDEGHRVVIPEIADYELRRELLRAEKERGLSRLDQLASLLEYLPITTPAMRRAAVFWAEARRSGRPAAHEKSLDADMILAGQAATLDSESVVIATTNVKHLDTYVRARNWHEIS